MAREAAIAASPRTRSAASPEMGRPRTLEERILRFLMREDVELRGEDLWRAIGGGRLF